jgi:cytosine/adenosine deaminase-related metal-dependent hydrolase
MGLFSRKKSLFDQGLLRGWTDWHSHILPGVDDGIRTLDDALAVLHWYAEQGVREVWLTPHVMEDCPNSPADLLERFAALRAAWNGPVVLHLAAENMLDAAGGVDIG